jgi:hypothetical protein
VPDFASGGYACSKYCDLADGAGERSCSALCPNGIVEVWRDEPLEVAGAYCMPGSGGVCDPLAPACDAGQGCFGYDPPACEMPGDGPVGAECDFLNTLCVAGTTCIGVEGSGTYYCQPYCDPAPAAAGANACSALCPNAFWQFDGYGICIPNE